MRPVPGEDRVPVFRDKNQLGIECENMLSASVYVIIISDEANYDGCVQLRYSYRLYPDPGQREALARAFGCARVVFNDTLSARQAAHAAGEPYITDAELSRRLTASKDTPERTWLGDVRPGADEAGEVGA